MALQLPDAWELDTRSAQRDESKRTASPGSFFYSQGKSLVLAASYFTDERLTDTARGGVAKKHRHKVQLALFGQLMAAFEYFLKDFVSKAVDYSSVLDARLVKEDWISKDLSVERILSNRNNAATAGSILVHSTMGWHDPETVNKRFTNLFGKGIVDRAQIEDLKKLWILRHTVAHNAGWLIPFDAQRIGKESLAGRPANIDDDFIKTTFDFLNILAK